jgi:hypothetical protein
MLNIGACLGFGLPALHQNGTGFAHSPALRGEGRYLKFGASIIKNLSDGRESADDKAHRCV